MRITAVEIENFRCFQHLEVRLSQGTNGDKGGVTVFVAANGEGKTAILDAIRYLLASFISRFPKIPVPRFKESDYRVEWEPKAGAPDVAFTPKPKAPYMRLRAVADFSHGQDNDPGSPVEWDLSQKRDKSARTKEELPPFLGTAQIHAQADSFIQRLQSEHPVMLPVFAYYNTERAVIRNKPERRRGFQKVFHRYDAYLGALDSGLNYKKAIEWFCFLEDKQRREMQNRRDWEYRSLEHQTIQMALETMLPGFTNLRTVLSPLDLIVDITANDGTFKACRIDSQLSDGYKIVLVLVLDIVSRILEANADYPGISPRELLETEGIILIDEVDLHLHPSWQQRILGDLRRTFPNLQFVVTTHSPQVVSSVPQECVRILDHGTILDAAIQTQGVESQDILAQIFGTAAAPQQDEFVKLLDEYARIAAAEQTDSERRRTMYEKLARHFGEHYAPLQRIELHRKFMERRRREFHA